MYFYKSHIGDGYFSDVLLSDDDLICSVCGGVDELICDSEDVDVIKLNINKSEIRYSKSLEEDAINNGYKPKNIEGYIFLE